MLTTAPPDASGQGSVPSAPAPAAGAALRCQARLVLSGAEAGSLEQPGGRPVEPCLDLLTLASSCHVSRTEARADVRGKEVGETRKPRRRFAQFRATLDPVGVWATMSSRTARRGHAVIAKETHSEFSMPRLLDLVRGSSQRAHDERSCGARTPRPLYTIIAR
jgi:hypothetical protein